MRPIDPAIESQGTFACQVPSPGTDYMRQNLADASPRAVLGRMLGRGAASRVTAAPSDVVVSRR